jgi:hypothetical protein
MAGHGCGAVVEDDKHEPGSLHDGVDQSVDSRVEKGRITDGGADSRKTLRGCLVSMVEARSLADGGPHAQHGIDHAQVEARGYSN